MNWKDLSKIYIANQSILNIILLIINQNLEGSIKRRFLIARIGANELIYLNTMDDSRIYSFIIRIGINQQ